MFYVDAIGDSQALSPLSLGSFLQKSKSNLQWPKKKKSSVSNLLLLKT